ncbi:mRNA binding post-transcriptional regulator [Venturia nashicola]|uniref:mRNA binding post-transcriptional regulator n=1 Tax=Venturia nashicola TaxID=86259 RepID=A0A4Z1NX69_9PEZI|nr:mRNA binding post-transcriptional regulator [Venturia nashicola]TLD23551.1 mRNA binding post-transcriptional regulator [Venturia nashicola]
MYGNKKPMGAPPMGFYGELMDQFTDPNNNTTVLVGGLSGRVTDQQAWVSTTIPLTRVIRCLASAESKPFLSTTSTTPCSLVLPPTDRTVSITFPTCTLMGGAGEGLRLQVLQNAVAESDWLFQFLTMTPLVSSDKAKLVTSGQRPTRQQISTLHYRRLSERHCSKPRRYRTWYGSTSSKEAARTGRYGSTPSKVNLPEMADSGFLKELSTLAGTGILKTSCQRWQVWVHSLKSESARYGRYWIPERAVNIGRYRSPKKKLSDLAVQLQEHGLDGEEEEGNINAKAGPPSDKPLNEMTITLEITGIGGMLAPHPQPTTTPTRMVEDDPIRFLSANFSDAESLESSESDSNNSSEEDSDEEDGDEEGSVGSDLLLTPAEQARILMEEMDEDGPITAAPHRTHNEKPGDFLDRCQSPHSISHRE